MVILDVVFQFYHRKRRKTACWTFQFVSGRVATLVELHFGDKVGGKVALVAFQNLINNDGINLKDSSKANRWQTSSVSSFPWRRFTRLLREISPSSSATNFPENKNCIYTL